MWRNDIKCEYMFMFPLKYLARKEILINNDDTPSICEIYSYWPWLPATCLLSVWWKMTWHWKIYVNYEWQWCNKLHTLFSRQFFGIHIVRYNYIGVSLYEYVMYIIICVVYVLMRMLLMMMMVMMMMMIIFPWHGRVSQKRSLPSWVLLLLYII